MKEYIANHYLRVGMRTVTPGEYFEAEYTEEQEQHLIGKGAMKIVESAPEKAEPVKAEPETEEPAQAEPGTASEMEAVEAEPEPPELDIESAIVPKKSGRKKG